MVWPDVNEKQLTRHHYHNIGASPKRWYITTFFYLLPLSAVILGKFLLLDASSKCLKLERKKTRQGGKVRRQTNGLQIGFKEACSKLSSQLENLFLLIILLHHPIGASSYWQ